MSVLRCIMSQKSKEKSNEEEKKDFVNFHWVAVMCSIVGGLALSLAVNVYFLLLKTNCITANYDYDTIIRNGDYQPLDTSGSPKRYSRKQHGHNDMTIEMLSSSDVTIDQLQTEQKSSPKKTRPFSMGGHRKMRGKRKFGAPEWNNGYQKVPVHEEGAVVYEETSLLG